MATTAIASTADKCTNIMQKNNIVQKNEAKKPSKFSQRFASRTNKLSKPNQWIHKPLIA